MAKIDPWSITFETECYAAVEIDLGFRCGLLKGWKLYALGKPNLYMTLSQKPSEILAAFETQEELEAWRESLYKASEPHKDDCPTLFDNVNYISKGNPEKGTPPFILSQIL